MNKITCVVDNAANEKTQLETEHGVAFWIETENGYVLFDSGQSASVLMKNLTSLRLDIKKLNAVAISHAHFDHTGGLEAILERHSGLAFYANTDIFHPRYFLRDGVHETIGFEYERDHYEKCADVRLSDEPAEILPNLWTTGEIIIRDEPEGRDAHLIKENGRFIPDPFKDDMSLVLKIANGLVLICGCCHAGLQIPLAQVAERFDGLVCAVIGGTHLMTMEGETLRHVINVLQAKYPDMHMYLNHCTGDIAIEALKDIYGNHVQHFTAGSSVKFKG